MEPKDYILDRIEGEYAYLKDINNGNEIFIALALLPLGAKKIGFDPEYTRKE